MRYVSACTTPGASSTGSSEPICVTRPVGSGPGDAVRNRIASGCENRGSASSSGTSLAEREAERDVDEVDADRVANEVGHLAAGDPRGDLDDGDAPSGDAISWGNAIPSRRPRAATTRSAVRSASSSWSEWIDAG